MPPVRGTDYASNTIKQNIIKSVEVESHHEGFPEGAMKLHPESFTFLSIAKRQPEIENTWHTDSRPAMNVWERYANPPKPYPETHDRIMTKAGTT